jgi:hypothetical protein
MKRSIDKLIVVGGLVWIMGVLFYVGSDPSLFQVVGQSDYGTLKSDTFGDPAKLRPYDDIAPEVCNEFNSQFLRDSQDIYHRDNPTKLELKYKGQGHYAFEFDSRGRGVTSMLNAVVREDLLSVYNKVAVKHGLPAMDSVQDVGSMGRHHLAGHGRLIIACTFSLAFYITVRVHRMFKRQEADIKQSLMKTA